MLKRTDPKPRSRRAINQKAYRDRRALGLFSPRLRLNEWAVTNALIATDCRVDADAADELDQGETVTPRYCTHR
jgi:hypothetical protein